MYTKNILVKDIAVHPRFRNPRGNHINTTDLQQSIKANGVLQPLLVEPNETGYYLLGGRRRLTAARMVGLETVPVVVHEPADDRERLRIIASSDLKEGIPLLVLDGNEIVGGKIYLISEMFAVGMPRYEIASHLGLTADAVGACVALATDLPEILDAVANERLGLTVYSLIKHRPADFKRFICSRKGQITADYVRKVIKNWEEIKGKLEEADEDDEVAAEEVVEEVTRKVEKESVPVAHLLQKALALLRQVQEAEPQHRFILEAIAEELERLS